MDKFKVNITTYAKNQVKNVAKYISEVLKAPQASKAWRDCLFEKISKLDVMSYRYKLVEAEPWRTYGVRCLHVGNFVVFYLIKESNRSIWVTAVIYEKRDQIKALSQMPII